MLVLLCIGTTEVLFHLKFELPSMKPYWLALYQWRVEKGGLMTWKILLPNMFLMWHTLNARHKMTAFMAIFWGLSDIILFNKLDHKLTEKPLCECESFILFYSVPVRACVTCLFVVPFKFGYWRYKIHLRFGDSLKQGHLWNLQFTNLV